MHNLRRKISIFLFIILGVYLISRIIAWPLSPLSMTSIALKNVTPFFIPQFFPQEIWTTETAVGDISMPFPNGVVVLLFVINLILLFLIACFSQNRYKKLEPVNKYKKGRILLGLPIILVLIIAIPASFVELNYRMSNCYGSTYDIIIENGNFYFSRLRQRNGSIYSGISISTFLFPAKKIIKWAENKKYNYFYLNDYDIVVQPNKEEEVKIYCLLRATAFDKGVPSSISPYWKR
jgi:hypothetical protein